MWLVEEVESELELKDKNRRLFPKDQSEGEEDENPEARSLMVTTGELGGILPRHSVGPEAPSILLKIHLVIKRDPIAGQWEQRDQAFRNKGPKDRKRWKQCTALQKGEGQEETTISRAFPRHRILELYLISFPPPSNPEKQASLTYRKRDTEERIQ
ncbi:Arf-Gap With Rho-Gap Domain, Ank Repeat And Ph Domain-Containing Protein 1 [Manis pentadactyla]|nr:Arf-Gap With Rho-Gap Domain, Ank Repeat And Ph Domain-Containing Protein 1 [Manis pentadactyla]